MARSYMMASEDRPLWRRIVDHPLVAMVIALAALLTFAAFAGGVTEVALRGSSPDTIGIASKVASVIAMIVVYKTFIRHLGEQSRDDLSRAGAIRETAAGIAIGFILFSVIVGVAALFGVYRIVGIGDARMLLVALVAAGLFPAVAEELLFRGILFRWIEPFGGTWAALIISSALFGASHLQNPNASWLAAVGIALEGGLLLGGAYMLTKRLWAPMGIHAAWNVTQGEVYDIPVSGTPVHGLVEAKLAGPPLLTGNGFGLEASLIAITIATAFAIYLIVRAARAGEIVPLRRVRPRTPNRRASAE
jgi:membrane protease YdiL (CAAX protease family)